MIAWLYEKRIESNLSNRILIQEMFMPEIKNIIFDVVL